MHSMPASIQMNVTKEKHHTNPSRFHLNVVTVNFKQVFSAKWWSSYISLVNLSSYSWSNSHTFSKGQCYHPYSFHWPCFFLYSENKSSRKRICASSYQQYYQSPCICSRVLCFSFYQNGWTVCFYPSPPPLIMDAIPSHLFKKFAPTVITSLSCIISFSLLYHSHLAY